MRNTIRCVGSRSTHLSKYLSKTTYITIFYHLYSMFFIIIIALIILFKIFDRVTNGYLGSYYGGAPAATRSQYKTPTRAQEKQEVRIIKANTQEYRAQQKAQRKAQRKVKQEAPRKVAELIAPLNDDDDDDDDDDDYHIEPLESDDDKSQQTQDQESMPPDNIEPEPERKRKRKPTPKTKRDYDQEYVSTQAVLSTAARSISALRMDPKKSGLTKYGKQRAAQNILANLRQLDQTLYGDDVEHRAETRRYIKDVQNLNLH
jgi:hypothetical protein